MQFKHNGLKFEASHLDHVVINTVRQVIEEGEATSKGRIVKQPRVTNQFEKVEEPGTRVWVRLVFPKTEHAPERVRWAKFQYYGEIPTEPGHQYDLEDAEDFGSDVDIRNMIQNAMLQPDKEVWFSGSYCNIRITKNWQDVQRIKAQEEARKRKIKLSQLFPRAVVSKLHGDAIKQSGARIVQGAIDTPFGPVPVMTIRGSGKRDLLRDLDELEKHGTFVSLDEAAKRLKIPRKKA